MMPNAKHHEITVYMSIPIQNFFRILIMIPPFESIVLPRVEFIKNRALNPITGNIILFGIISPPFGQGFD